MTTSLLNSCRKASQPSDADAGLRVVAVHMEDRRLDHPGYVSAEYIEDRNSVGDVVKPTWLFTTM